MSSSCFIIGKKILLFTMLAIFVGPAIHLHANSELHKVTQEITKQTSAIDAILEELAQAVTVGTVKVADKKLVKEHIYTLRTFITDVQQDDIADPAHKVAINNALIRHINTIVKNDFTKLDTISRVYSIRTKSGSYQADQEPDMAQLKNYIQSSHMQLQTVRKNFDLLGTTAINRGARLLQKFNEKLHLTAIAKRAFPYVALSTYAILALHESTFENMPVLCDLKKKLGGLPGKKSVTSVSETTKKPGEPDLANAKRTETKDVPDIKTGWLGSPLSQYARLLTIKAEPFVTFAPVAFFSPYIINDAKELSAWTATKCKKSWAALRGESFDDGSKIKQSKIDFSKVIGQSTPKDILKKAVNYFKHKDSFDRMALHPDKGYLFVGSLDMGKTLAHALAGEITGELKKKDADSFCGVYEIHASILLQKDVKDIVEDAQKNNACVLVIEEIDWLAKQKNIDSKIWSSLVTHMSGTLKNYKKHVFIIATAQETKQLDVTLQDYGRLGVTIYIEKQTAQDRREFFELELKNRCLNIADFDIEKYVRLTQNCSLTQLAIILKRALAQAHAQAESLAQKHIEQSIQETLYNIVPAHIHHEEKQMLAAYYAGKTVAHKSLNINKPIQYVTILPVQAHTEQPTRGALLTYNPSESSRLTKQDIEHNCIIELAGLLAQEQLFNKAVDAKLHQEIQQEVAGQIMQLVYVGIDPKELPKAVREEKQAHYWQLLQDYRKKAQVLLANSSQQMQVVADYLLDNATLDGQVLADLVIG